MKMAQFTIRIWFCNVMHFLICGYLLHYTKRRKMKVITNVGTHSIDTQRLLLRRFEYSDNASMRKYWVSDKNALYVSWTCLHNWIRGQRTSRQIYRLISEWRLLSLCYNRQEYLWMYWSDCLLFCWQQHIISSQDILQKSNMSKEATLLSRLH